MLESQKNTDADSHLLKISRHHNDACKCPTGSASQGELWPQFHMPKFHIWKLTELLYYCRYECDIGLCRWGQMIQLSNKINSKKYSPS